MPTYVYNCENCQTSFEVKQSLKDDPLTKCESCGKESLYKSIQSCFIVGEPVTVGQLAERNTKKMGKYHLEKLRKDHAESGQAAADQAYADVGKKRINNELAKKLAKATPEQKKKYIHEGKI